MSEEKKQLLESLVQMPRGYSPVSEKYLKILLDLDSELSKQLYTVLNYIKSKHPKILVSRELLTNLISHYTKGSHLFYVAYCLSFFGIDKSKVKLVDLTSSFKVDLIRVIDAEQLNNDLRLIFVSNLRKEVLLELSLRLLSERRRLLFVPLITLVPDRGILLDRINLLCYETTGTPTDTFNHLASLMGIDICSLKLSDLN